MKSIKNSKYKKFIALCLSVMMVSSAVATLAACNDSSSSDGTSDDTTETTTEKDTSIITNGSFEFNTKKDTTLIVTSPSGWTRSTNSATSGSASSSQSASGILDTASESWDDLTKSAIESTLNKKPEELTVSEAKANWSKMSSYDKLKFFEAYEEADDDNDIEDLEFYDSKTDSFNIDAEDIPLPSDGNPGTHLKEGDEGYGEDTNILMIHNQYTDNRGTAQKYTSSTTVTVPAGAAATVSVWVKTSDLQTKHTNGDTQDVIGNRGAYIGVTHTVGGKTLDQFMVKNIDTKNVDGVNEWVEYNFYLQGSSYADSTFTMVLGLGLGGGTDIFEYVNGYAFFDDITCEIMTADELVVPNDAVAAYLHSEAEDKVFEADKVATQTNPNYVKGKTNFALDLQPNNAFGVPNLSGSDFKIGITEEVKGGSTLVSANGEKLTDGNKEIYGELGFDVTNDVKGLYNSFAAIGEAATATSNPYLTAVYEKNFKDKTVFANTQTLLLMSADGAAYTAKLNREFTVKAGEKLAVSFFVKTSDIAGFTGAGVTLHDGENVTSFDSIDTTSVTKVKIGNNEDVYDGWQQCFFFVENDTDNDKTFTLSFNYGKTTVYGTTKADYYPGFAAFTNFQTLDMEDKEYECASTGTYAKTVSLTANEKEEQSGNQFDAVATTPSDEIETTFADPKNYKGVVGGSAYVNFGGLNATVNSSDYAGLINKEYIDAYATSDWAQALATNGETLANLFGNSTQPLLIYNNVEQAYGFIGNKQTVSADSYKAVSVRLKVSASAVAYVYLADMDDTEDKSILSIARKISFWYDDDGNVCEEDPSENKSKSNIAFKLQSNGLYKVNAQWDKNGVYDGYFANLSNYDKDENGNLIVAEGGVSYNYNDKWENEGNDGIAFYHKDGKYYADKACTVLVHDLAEVVNAQGVKIARYQATRDEQAGKLFYKIEGTEASPAWQTVTFYIHTGSEAKNFRLEVWSGSRDNAVRSAAGSYVLFDVNNPGDLTADSFTNLIKEFEDDAQASFKDTFSFYDSNKFLRYNETIDENEVGNSYKSYVSSAYTEGTAYLAHYANGVYEKFFDYSLSEVSVAADVNDDNTTTTPDAEETVAETNMFLLVSSLAIAAVLLLAVVSLVVRKVFLKNRGKKVRTVKPEKKSDKAPKAKKEKPAKKAEEPKDENDPYND